MKTAKELCEEIKEKNLLNIIQSVADGGGSSRYAFWDNHSYYKIPEHAEKLRSLGYKVEEVKTYSYYRKFPQFWKHEEIINTHWVVSACCNGEEK